MIDLRAVIEKLSHTEAHLDAGMSDADADEHRGNVRDALRALEAMLPEELEGRCGCETNPQHWYALMGDEGKWYARAADGTHVAPCGPVCSGCGWRLGADGIARRHPDTRRAALLDARVAEFEARTAEYVLNFPRAAVMWEQIRAQDPFGDGLWVLNARQDDGRALEMLEELGLIYRDETAIGDDVGTIYKTTLHGHQIMDENANAAQGGADGE